MTSEVDKYEIGKQNICIKNNVPEFGRGSYATVLELNYNGLKCAGKKIHDTLLKKDQGRYPIQRFHEECSLLSQVRHPNIVQFLGLHFEDGETVPILVMEYLPTNLTQCIEKYYDSLSDEIRLSILHDVALGLHYLHSHIPNPIVHRDLSSNNILLTINMSAKISDLGVARIVNLSQRQVQQLTEYPGTPDFMPPEAMVSSPSYGLGVDVFSYGIIMIHTFTGKWPSAHVQQANLVDGVLVPYTEAERRAEYLHSIGESHSLKDLILKCIHNDPQQRPTARDLVSNISMFISNPPPSFNNQLEMLQKIKDYESQRNELEKKKDEMMLQVKKKLVELQAHKQKVDNISEVYSTKINDRSLEIEDLNKSIAKLREENVSLENKLKKRSEELHNIQLSLREAQNFIADCDHEEHASDAYLNFSFALSLPKLHPPFPSTLAIGPTTDRFSNKESYIDEIDASDHCMPLKGCSDPVTMKLNDSSKSTKLKDSNFPTLMSASQENLTFNQVLQTGFFSTVWKGVMNKCTDVAIRQPNPNTMSIAEYSKLADIMNKHQHHNIIKLLAVCTTGETMSIVTEFINSSLLQHLRLEETRSSPLQTLINMSMQVVEGMVYLEKQKCIHRDLAARSVLVSETLTCKITNFELAQISQESVVEAITNLMFPIKWTACEIFLTNPHKSSTKSDVWSFGILLWEMVTFGCLPYSKMTNRQTQKEVLNGYRMPCPPGCPKDLYTIMLTCWRDTPSDRPHFEGLQHQLREISNKLKHTKKMHRSIPLNGDLFKPSSLHDTKDTNTIYDRISHEEEGGSEALHQQGVQCEAIYIPSTHWNKDSNKQHVEVAEEIASLNLPGFFTTYKGVLNKETPVAIKAYSPYTMSTTEFVQQATVMVNMQHKNVCKFFSAFTNKNSMYTISELIETDLSAYLQSKARSIKHQKLIDMSLQITDGMIYMGEQKCILRNLSASNVLIIVSGSKQHTCKIANFDLAQIANNNLVMADPESKFPVRSSAPEAIIHCQFSTHSDVWSFGILLWEIFTYGSKPYPRMTNSQVREYLHEGYHMSCPHECPKALYDTVISECWKQNPIERPSFKQVKESLKRCLVKFSDIYVREKVERKSMEAEISSDSDDDSFHGGHLVDTNPIYRANSDYNAKEESELSFKKEQLLSVNVTKDSENCSWYWGTAITTRKEGFIPSHHLPKQPLIKFRKKLSQGTHGPIWECLWHGRNITTVKFEQDTSLYTKDIIALRDTNVAQVFAVYHPSYIVMEPMKHGKLNEFLQHKGYSLDMSQVITLSTQIAAGMAYLEGKNCILRNLAARNVLVGSGVTLTCKISNFSSAKIVSRIYDSSQGGIYTYIESGIIVCEDEKHTRFALKWTSPEAATEKRFSTKSDVWSFGVVVSEIITQGGIPYPNMTNDETLEYVLNGNRMPQPDDCPDKLYSIMVDCWQRDFTQRPSFDCLKRKLKELVST